MKNRLFLQNRLFLRKGAAIWTPGTLYDGTTFVSDFVLQSREIYIHEYNLGGVERYLSFAPTQKGRNF